jgi:hypothetical protein
MERVMQFIGNVAINIYGVEMLFIDNNVLKMYLLNNILKYRFDKLYRD